MKKIAAVVLMVFGLGMALQAASLAQESCAAAKAACKKVCKTNFSPKNIHKTKK